MARPPNQATISGTNTITPFLYPLLDSLPSQGKEEGCEQQTEVARHEDLQGEHKRREESDRKKWGEQGKQGLRRSRSHDYSSSVCWLPSPAHRASSNCTSYLTIFDAIPRWLRQLAGGGHFVGLWHIAKQLVEPSVPPKNFNPCHCRSFCCY